MESMEDQPKKRFEMLFELDKGAFGEVWIARDLERPDDAPKKYVVVKFELNQSP
jgi:hypothetical protein